MIATKRGKTLKPRTIGIESRQARAGVLFVLPWLAGISLFFLYPLVSSMYNSFFSFRGLRPDQFVGFSNYAKLFKDTKFTMSISNTFVFAAFSIPIGTVFTILIALMINVKTKLQGIYRVISFIPTLMPTVAVSIIWMWLLNTQFGIVNYLLGLLGILGPPWLGSPAWAKPSIMLIGMWGVGSTVIIYLAGLQDIPVELYESAKIDGAGAFARLRKITLPLLSPVIFYNLIMGIISCFQSFAVPYIVGGIMGAPAGSLLFYSMMIYKYAFQYFQMGMANAMAWMMFVVVLLLTLILQATSKKWVHYMGE